ncbi:MAG: hypothetical protein K2X87_33485 [Gemmataceae bacterium]|nr:hypothetical protein [Gemmataceae bacterium]
MAVPSGRYVGLVIAGGLVALASCESAVPVPEAHAPVVVGPPVVRYEPTGPGGAAGRFEVRGLPEGHLAALADPGRRAAAFVVRAETGPGLLGTSGVDGGVLWFRPRFPLAYGVRHTAAFDPAALPGGAAGPSSVEVTLTHPPAPPPAVTGVYPSGDTVPENLLKFYLTFSAPMRRGEAYHRVRLLGPDRAAIDLPFLELDEELWDPTGTRLTLLIDPGRIKRGLKPREDVGPVLEAGGRYTLVVDGGWPDAAGRPLGGAVEKAYTVAAPAAERVDPAAWTLTPPTVRDGALEVRFPRPLDRALLERSLAVADAAGRPVAGTAEVAAGEGGWRFTPSGPWPPGDYHLLVGPDLEDLAGNRPDRLFDTDGRAAPDTAPPVLTRVFRVP